MHIIIFKTNIRFKKDVKKIEPVLNAHPVILRWTVDREDVDNVLRIEATQEHTHELITTIRQAGFLCEELPD